MTNEQLIIVATIIGTILTYLNARTTASSGAVLALTATIVTLRTELKEAEESRERLEKKYDYLLNEEAEKRRKLEKRLVRYQAYIRELRDIMQKSGLVIPEWENEEDL